MEDKWMNEYTFHLVSMLNDIPYTINAVIYAKDHLDADRLFYWKILTEFTPFEYAHIILNAKEDNCTVRHLQGLDAVNCNRGILIFRAIRNDELIRSLEKMADKSRGNLHPGVIRREEEESNLGDTIVYVAISIGALFVLATFIRFLVIRIGG